MSWWNRKYPLGGAVLFRGDLAAQPHEFAFLEQQRITTQLRNDSNTTGWTMDLTHPEWGKATLKCDPNALLPPREVIECSFMPQADKDACISSRNSVYLTMESKHDNILRDRKLLLRYLYAVMGSDGVAAIDMMSLKIWTRDDLHDELSHDADLDVEGIIGIHAITGDDDQECFWLHSHGLAEIGSYDFDILRPSETVRDNAWELARAVAYHLLEVSLGPSTENFPLVYPNGNVKMVEMSKFLDGTTPEIRELLMSSMYDSHKEKHLVLCQPDGGFFKRLLGSKSIMPARFLTEDLMENPMFSFSDKASDLMRDRAQNTYQLFRSLREEFAEFDFVYLVKLGIPTDPGAPSSHEHMWFAIDNLTDTEIEGELGNEPYYIKSMKEGDHSTHSIDLLSDWMIMTPVGLINPRSTAAARIVREDPEKVREMMKE